MAEDKDLEKIKLLVETMNIEINSYTPWVARKEIAAWTAIAFYIALIGALIGFIFRILNSVSSPVAIILFFPVTALLVALSILFIVFIHSQFSSIYDKKALTRALRKKIYDLIDSGNLDSSDLKYGKNNVSIPNFINSKYTAFTKKYEEIIKKDKWRPLYLLKSLRTLNYEENFGLHGRQEAIIYLLLICSFLGYLFFMLTTIFFQLIL